MIGNEEYYRRKLKSAETFFSRWVGADGIMLELTRSHKSLAVLLSRKDSSGNLLIACIGPERLQGPVEWANSRFRASTVTVGNELMFRVYDQEAGVEVICAALEVKENVRLP